MKQLIKHIRKISGYSMGQLRAIAVLSLFTMLLLYSCTPVKEYEKNKLNDAEMVLGNRPVEKTELSFQSYREGSSGANAGKVGGGCGCN